ncbi:glutathione S-transferase [Meredithblackwellia eburnea MCA 4105]
MSVILYDLVTAPGGALFSPNTYKARLCLLQKGVQFTTRQVTFHDLRTHLKERLGGQKVLVPLIELEDGTIISESANIAEWLEKTYPDRSSVFLPGEAGPVNQSSASYQTAKNYALMMDLGLGSSGSEWSSFWELAAPGLQRLMISDGPESDGSYMKSDEKLGEKDGWSRILSLDQDALKRRAHNALIPVENVLKGTVFLTGRAPGYVDYVVYGRYIMMSVGCPEVAQEVWMGRPLVASWIERLESLYSEGLKECLSTIPSRK